ncbi:MAG TPA: hypothetical protein VLT84_01860 [Acidobacteriota bacterium]|nr:hypothetical protein [Acidobacteriota bacterium]
MPIESRLLLASRLVRVAVAALAAAAGVSVAGAPERASAQTVRPVIVEYEGKKVHGKFELANDQLLPVNVILEAKSFDVTEEGDPLYRPLDASLRVKLSEMSLRIPARQSRTIFFEARADSVPAWFTIYATFAGMPRREGVEIEIELPHTVYMLPKQPLRKDDVRVETAVWDSAAHRVEVRLRNTSGRLGRVVEAEASARKERRRHGSFPLLPGATRRFLIPWDAADAPSRLRIEFQRFSLEDSLRTG